MKHIFSIILTISILILFTGTAYSGGKSKTNVHHNMSYQIMKIKHRAKRGFTNHGRVSYTYTTDKHVGKNHSAATGTVLVGKRSRLREVYNAVELFGYHRFDHDGDEPLNIGTVTDQSGRLKRVETYVKIIKPIKY